MMHVCMCAVVGSTHGALLELLLLRWRASAAAQRPLEGRPPHVRAGERSPARTSADACEQREVCVLHEVPRELPQVDAAQVCLLPPFVSSSPVAPRLAVRAL